MQLAHSPALDCRITVLRPQGDAELAWIGAALLRQEAEVLGHARRPVGIFLRNAEGGMAGGISAYQTGPDFYIQYLWVAADQRKAGLGRVLMQAAEHAAGARGALRLYLNTISFQAPGFYQKMGYVEEGRLTDFIKGSDRHYLRKDVEPRPLPAPPVGLRLDITDAPDPADIQRVDDGLTEHWKTVGPEHQDVAALALDAAGAPVGGISGVVDGYAFTIVHAWVEAQARGRGLGRRLTAALEEVARENGCRHATVYPLDWQAPGFWARQGYTPVLRVDDYICGQGRSWMRKELTS